MIWIIRHGGLPAANAGAELQSAIAHRLLSGALNSAGYQGAVAKTQYGKPYINGRPDLNVSLSHCEGLVLCAVENRPVGIDAEKIRAFNPLVASRVCTPKELESIEQDANPRRMFFRIWTLKESYGKMLGAGLGFPMREAEFHISSRVSSNIKNCEFTLFEQFEGYIIALCRLNG